MGSTRIYKAFPGLYYWARLPGFAAFCGIAAGIGGAKAVLARWPEFAPAAGWAAGLAPVAAVLLAAAGILCGRQWRRAAIFAACGAVLFAGAELRGRDFYRRMEAVCEHRQIFTLTARITSPVASAYSSNRFRGRVIGADDAEVAAALTNRTLQFTSRGRVPPYGIITVQGRYSAPRPAAGPFGFDQREHYAVNNIHGNFAVSRVIAGNNAGNDITNSNVTDSNIPNSNITVSNIPKSNIPDSNMTNGNIAVNEASAPKKRPAPILTKLSPDNISHTLRTTVHGVINKASTPEARAIFHAAFLGEKEHLTPALNASFRRSGIIHLLAISGFHAALLYSAVFAALGLLFITDRQRTLFALAFLWGYLFFIGFIPSLFRATVMVTLFCLSTATQRKNHVVHSLGIAGVFWLLMSPHSLFAPGFQLSFAATAGIVMLQPVLNGLTRAVNEKINNKPAEFLVGKTLSPLWVSIAGFAATAPPLLHHFGTLSLYGILFNLIAIPLMSAAMWLFFIAIVLSPVDFAAGIAVWGAEKMLTIMVYLSGLSDRVGWSEIVIPVTTAPQIAIMVLFMAGLCGVRKNLRGRFALRAGAAAFAVWAAAAIHLSLTAKTENLEFTRNNSTVNVITYKDNAAWIVAQGRKNDIRQLRTREIEPLLYRKRIRSVPLFLISEEAEEEAHEFAFGTDFDPRIISMRPNVDAAGKTDQPRGYTLISASALISANGACSLIVDGNGRAAIARPPRSYRR